MVILCIYCKRLVDADLIRNRQRNTMYTNDAENWMCSCDSCYLADYDYYAERWADHYTATL